MCVCVRQQLKLEFTITAIAKVYNNKIDKSEFATPNKVQTTSTYSQPPTPAFIFKHTHRHIHVLVLTKSEFKDKPLKANTATLVLSSK